MDRRHFIKTAAASAAGAVIAPELLAQERVVAGVILPGVIESDGKAGNVSNGVEDHLAVSGYVREPAHRIPVVASADVVVVGGGPAGVSAAICAAREGASVILAEKQNFLGGLWTGGLVLPVLATRGMGKNSTTERATGGFCMEVCNELLEKGWAVNPNDPRVDPEATKYLLDKLIMDAGVKVIYNSTAAGVTMSGNRIDSILLDCHTGRIAIKCKEVVDATGDGCVFNWAGDPHEDRRYHLSIESRIEGLPNYQRTPIPGMKVMGINRHDAMDCLDIFKVSERQQQGRIELWDKIEAMKKEPGNEKVHLIEVAPVTGIRVTRVLESLHNVTLAESMEWTEFPDKIGMGGLCDPFDYKGKRITLKNRPIWQIPYRSLVPKETQNLLVAGRCFGYDQGITWDAREISTCMVTGQAAGVAAAMALNARCAAKEVNIPTLQDKLRKAGVRLDF